jgi:hypothetical protein
MQMWLPADKQVIFQKKNASQQHPDNGFDAIKAEAAEVRD